MIELEFGPDGKARSIYQDEILPVLDALGQKKVARASNVEWEDGGWTVRAAHNPEIAIRIRVRHGCYEQYVAMDSGDLVVFVTREAALEAEQRFFWELLPPHK